MALITDCVAYWKMDESSGNMLDEVNSADGILHGGITQNSTGKINTAYIFDGVNGTNVIMDGSSSQLALSGNMSISFWVYPDSVDTDYVIQKGVWNADGYIFALEGETSMVFYTSQTGVAQTTRTSTGIENDAWNHIVITLGSGVSKIYLNGTELGYSTHHTHTAPKATTSDLYIGSHVTGIVPYDGTLDEIGFWNRTLSPAEVTSLHNSGDGLAYPFAVGTNMKININDTFEDVDSIQINIGDVWKDVNSIQQNIGDAWKTVF